MKLLSAFYDAVRLNKKGIINEKHKLYLTLQKHNRTKGLGKNKIIRKWIAVRNSISFFSSFSLRQKIAKAEK